MKSSASHPNIYRTDERGNYLLDDKGQRQAVTVSMKELANGTEEGDLQVKTVLHLYGEWTASLTREIGDLPARFRPAASPPRGAGSRSPYPDAGRLGDDGLRPSSDPSFPMGERGDALSASPFKTCRCAKSNVAETTSSASRACTPRPPFRRTEVRGVRSRLPLSSRASLSSSTQPRRPARSWI